MRTYLSWELVLQEIKATIVVKAAIVKERKVCVFFSVYYYTVTSKL